MRLGLGFFNAGTPRSYTTIARMAQQAETLGYDSLWVTEREPFPIATRSQTPGESAELLFSSREVHDPMSALAVAAISTERITLGVSLPNVPFYSPVDVGRRLASLDRLSDGRVQLGLGLGWNATEIRAVADALQLPDSPASEFMTTLRMVWRGDGTRFEGSHFILDQPAMRVTPIQPTMPPTSLVAFAPAAVQRAAMLLQGGSPIHVVLSHEEMTDALLGVAPSPIAGYGLTVRAIVRPTTGPVGETRSMFTGSLNQIRDDIAFVHGLGADELQLDLCRFAVDDPSSLPDLLAALADLVPASCRAPKREPIIAA